MKVDPKIRSRLFPALDRQVDEMVANGVSEIDTLNAVMFFATERLMDMLPGMIPPEHSAEFQKVVLGGGSGND